MIGRRLPYYNKKRIGGIDANTLLMLHCEDLTDSSASNATISNSGLVVSQNKNKFGSKSLYVSNGGYATVSLTNSLSDFTLDYWLYPISYSPSKTDTGVGLYITFARRSETGYWDLVSPTRIWYTNTGNITMPVENWNHIAITRSGYTIRAFVNGVLKVSTSVSDSFSLSSFVIGKECVSSSPSLICYVDEIRVSNIARWTSDFTPPTQPYDEG